MAEEPGFNSGQGQEIFLFPKASSETFDPTEPATQWTPEDLSSGIKGPESKADYSPSIYSQS
jgi:hypothetical protein